MDSGDLVHWQEMGSAPRDGTPLLVRVRASEQGPAEVDVVRWLRPDRAAEECWVSVESDPDCAIIYAEIEVVGWMPVPDQLPPLRSGRPTEASRPDPQARPSEEVAGSGI